MARLYQADPASTDWRHLGRLAGFTNQKPIRRLPAGWPPWVKILHRAVGLAPNGTSLIEAASRRLTLAPAAPSPLDSRSPIPQAPSPSSHPPDKALTPDDAAAVYQTWLHRLRIPQRFPHPDWSIADLWIATELLLRDTPAEDVKTILRLASPQFPRRHANPC